jgi:hypothetical protein
MSSVAAPLWDRTLGREYAAALRFADPVDRDAVLLLRTLIRGLGRQARGSEARPITEVRGLVADVHHGLNQKRATGDAEALSRVHELACGAGMGPDDLGQISDGFKIIAERLIDDPEQNRRRWSMRTHWQRGARSLDHGDERRELPPGAP